MSHFHASYNLDDAFHLSTSLSVYVQFEGTSWVNDAVLCYFPYFKIVLHVWLHFEMVYSNKFWCYGNQARFTSEPFIGCVYMQDPFWFRNEFPTDFQSEIISCNIKIHQKIFVFLVFVFSYGILFIELMTRALKVMVFITFFRRSNQDNAGLFPKWQQKINIVLSISNIKWNDLCSVRTI